MPGQDAPAARDATTNIYPAIDQTRGLIVMDQVVPADFGVNNNAMSSAVVMDERGNVLATLEQFFFFNTFLNRAEASSRRIGI